MYMEDIFALIGGMIIGIVIAVLIGLVLWILEMIGKYKAFTKAGQQGYTGLIPMVDEFVMGLRARRSGCSCGCASCPRSSGCKKK